MDRFSAWEEEVQVSEMGLRNPGLHLGLISKVHLEKARRGVRGKLMISESHRAAVWEARAWGEGGHGRNGGKRPQSQPCAK